MKLQVFVNTCSRCGFKFTSLHQPRDYGLLLYVSRTGALRYLDPEADSVWAETTQLIDRTTAGNQLAPVEKARLQHLLLARTIDPIGNDDIFGSAWERQPCPRCGSSERDYFGPIDPPQFENVDVEPVAHEMWDDRSSEEKYLEALSLVRQEGQSRHSPATK